MKVVVDRPSECCAHVANFVAELANSRIREDGLSGTHTRACVSQPMVGLRLRGVDPLPHPPRRPKKGGNRGAISPAILSAGQPSLALFARLAHADAEAEACLKHTAAIRTHMGRCGRKSVVATGNHRRCHWRGCLASRAVAAASSRDSHVASATAFSRAGRRSSRGRRT